MNLTVSDVLGILATHLATLVATTLSLVAAALFAYFREQINVGIKWALAPLAIRLPWNQNNIGVGSTLGNQSSLASDLTVIDVFLMTTDGRTARYQKTANYPVNSDFVHAYREGVTGSGAVDGFSTLVGSIVETTREHGFYITRIDLADLLRDGFQFQNVFAADLHNCFTSTEEHWTQEIPRPTKHLTLRIHFPAGRPPKLVKCKLVEGVSSRRIKTDAKITELSRKQGIVWDIRSRVGALGAGFAVVAQEVRGVGQQVETIAQELGTQLTQRIGDLVSSIERMNHRSRGERMVDLSLNAIELIDRNLYERTCDVRWWATDSALVDCAASPTSTALSYASERLGVILGAYTVYLDLWLCDLHGNVIANGRAGRFNVVGQSVANTKWFREALSLHSGDDYVAGDIESQPLLANAQVATYCATVRAGGRATGAPIGVLAIHFDWEPQARAIVQGVRVGDKDKARVMLVDSKFRVIASSDGLTTLNERMSLSSGGKRSGFYKDRTGTLIAFHATPGYETYCGLGWFGVIVCTGNV